MCHLKGDSSRVINRPHFHGAVDMFHCNVDSNCTEGYFRILVHFRGINSSKISVSDSFKDDLSSTNTRTLPGCIVYSVVDEEVLGNHLKV